MNWEDRIREALKLEMPYQDRAHRQLAESLLPAAKPAAVLVLMAMEGEDPALLYTRRTHSVDTHKGQIAFPGGQCERTETGEWETPESAALRETEEEVVGSPGTELEFAL